MREQPPAEDLLAVVAEFLRSELMPRLDGRLAFHTRVAANVLDIVRREIAEGLPAERAARARLAALLGHDGGAESLNTELCDRIAAGEVDPADPALTDHLWASTLETLTVDQPNYGTYRRALEIQVEVGSSTNREK